MKALRMAKGLFLLGCYLCMLPLAIAAEKFSRWFDEWNISTFGW